MLMMLPDSFESQEWLMLMLLPELFESQESLMPMMPFAVTGIGKPGVAESSCWLGFVSQEWLTLLMLPEVAEF